MDNPSVKKSQLNDLMQTAMEKVREMVDTNTIVGQPITTPDGVTLIPISKVSFGFGGAGGDYGKTQPKDFGGGSAAGVKDRSRGVFGHSGRNHPGAACGGASGIHVGPCGRDGAGSDG